MTEPIIGHTKILNFFTKAIESGRLSHAYCLVGQDRIGKKTVAEEVGSRLLGVTRDKLYTQPDAFLVGQELNEKTGKTKKNIDVEQIRELKYFLTLSSFLGKYKVAIIDEAEKLSSGAANALLKILEEPGSKTIIFLITVNEEELPRTITSRCQMLYAEPVPEGVIGKWLESRGVEESKMIAENVFGCPGLALEWAKEPELSGSRKKEVARFVSLFGKPLYEKIKTVEDLFGNKEDHIAEREKLDSLLGLWGIYALDLFYAKKSLQKIVGRSIAAEVKINREDVLSIEDKIRQARELFGFNIHPRLLMEQILLAIP